MLSNMDTLNRGIELLNANISALRGQVNTLASTVHQGFSISIAENNAISSQLEAIKFDTHYLMLDQFFS